MTTSIARPDPKIDDPAPGVPAPRVGVAAAVIGAALAGVAVLTVCVATAGGPTGVDQGVLDWMVGHRGGAMTSAVRVFTDLGGAVAMTALAVGTVLWFAWRREWPTAALVAVTALGAAILVPACKHLAGRTRPPEQTRLVVENSLSYPSGHALGTTVVTGIVATVLISRIARPSLRAAAAACAVAFVLGIGLSRLYLGVHWATDVLAGVLIGVAWVTLCLTLFGLSRRRGMWRGTDQREPSTNM
ncbi:phosphatase PAP2 family protein [Nocardia thailandica]|uniref:phosphatase PAP2 family protein n=1 Tax=Nocardia thailandica TaxID=257275 RepID=UPI0002DAE79C|nr:phosphatase PAP2 family protein [Nocardia thailandica]